MSLLNTLPNAWMTLSPATRKPVKRANTHAATPAPARTAARRPRRATTAATTTSPTPHNEPNAERDSEEAVQRAGQAAEEHVGGALGRAEVVGADGGDGNDQRCDNETDPVAGEPSIRPLIGVTEGRHGVGR